MLGSPLDVATVVKDQLNSDGFSEIELGAKVLPILSLNVSIFKEIEISEFAGHQEPFRKKVCFLLAIPGKFRRDRKVDIGGERYRSGLNRS